VARRSDPWAWCSLSAADADPTRFLLALSQALAHAPHPALRALAGRVAPEGADVPLDSALAALLNELAGLGAPTLLVLDRFEQVAGGSVAHYMAGFVADGLPPGSTLALASRGAVPRGALGERWAERDVVRLGGDALALREAEVAGLLGLAGDDPLVVRALDLSDGWAVTLALVRREIERGAAPAEAVEQLSCPSGDLRAYLEEEVFGPLPEELRELALDLASLGAVGPGECDRLRGGGSAALLARLDDLGLLRADAGGHRLLTPLRAHLQRVADAGRRERLGWTLAVGAPEAARPNGPHGSRALPAALRGWLTTSRAPAATPGFPALLGATLAWLAEADAGRAAPGRADAGAVGLRALLERLERQEPTAAAGLLRALLRDCPSGPARALLLR
jgi:hypothetical protein